MAVVLDETTRGEYLAQSLASSRAALVVSALTGTVTVEVRDGGDVLRASGTMAAPWATSSGATITVGQVTGAGLNVTSGGVPDANWYCQLKAGSRFVRGTFGVSTSSADFRWSLATFQTGSRGTLAAVSLTATGTSVVSPLLIQPNDLAYRGAFALPTSGDPSYAFGGQALAFNPAGNGGAGSLFMTGFVGRSIGEFTIPELVDQTGVNNISALRVAQHIQTPVTAGFGQFTNAHINAERKLKGLLVHNGRLIVSCDADYSSTPPTATHLRQPLNLSTSGQFEGPYKVTAATAQYGNGRFWSGYMAHVPAQWQSALGGPCITGNVGDSIVGNASDGPAALAFDPDKLQLGDVTGSPLLCHPPGFPLFDTLANVNKGISNAPWSWASVLNGAVIPNGTRSMLCIGANGVGELIYGTPTTDWTLHNTPTGAGFNWVYDPANPSGNGEHAYPYRYTIWAYDLNDLAAAKAGTIQPHEVRPYSRWEFTLPFEGTRVWSTPDLDPDGHSLGGCCYDPAQRRLFVTQGVGGLGARFGAGFSIIHVFEVTNAVAS